MFELVLITMFIAGCIGGLINSFLTDPKTENALPWWKHMVIGVGAAFMIPVFLNMISSKLIADIKPPPMEPSNVANLLILGGFFLVAAVSSRAFIRSLTDRVLQDVSTAKKDAKDAKQDAEEAKKLAANAEGIAALSVPSDIADDAVSESHALAAPVVAIKPNLSELETSTLAAMVYGHTPMRSISGISKDTGLPKDQVNSAISSAMVKELVAQSMNQESQPRWYATPAGRLAAASV